MKNLILFLSFIFGYTLFADEIVRTEVLSDGWKFRLEEEAEWRNVNVPHDWGVERGFLKAGRCPGQGDLPYVGKGYYRRAFDGFTPPKGGRTYLTLDGVQCRSVVKLNGKVVGGRPFGYASETIDITEALKESSNILEVEAENFPESSRWYPGSGIFRDVTVRVCPKDHVKPNTLFIRTLEASENAATVAVTFDWRGGTSNFTFTVDNPSLWSPENPYLYEIELFGERFRYGIRTAVFDPQKGFFLNGVHRQMRGVCMHHDLGPVGAAFDRDFARRQLALLKEMGCDAIRTSHNPPAEALLDLCDEMGIMVMDEAFDMWEGWKGDYAQFFKAWHKRDLTDFICRDRSHPSVVMWSIGNELVEHKDNDPSKAIRIAKELTAIIKANDPTRPVTFGCFRQKPMWNGCQNSVDAFGANYLPFKYAEFLRRNPTVGLVGTETSSTVSSRGEYFFPVVASPIKGENDLIHRRNECRTNMVVGAQMSGYDLWGPHPNDYPPDVEFEHQERNPQVYGEFVWTGFDYLGEPDPCAQSGGRSSYFGIFDLAGIPKDRYWLYKSHWRSNVPSAHILPHWTWPGREGELTPVHVYTSGDEAELFVNGVSKGRKKRGRYEYRFIWDDVRYEPGELRVKTWKAGRDWAEDIVRTASKPVRIERQERKFGRLTFITFALKDKNGELCPNSDRAISFTTRQGTRLISLCNGDASSRERFNGSSMCTFHGLLVAAVEGPAEGLKCSLSDNDGTKSHKSE
jgi:beta-galactosidase